MYSDFSAFNWVCTRARARLDNVEWINAPLVHMSAYPFSKLSKRARARVHARLNAEKSE